MVQASTKEEALFVNEILRQAYDKLKEKLAGREVAFSNDVRSEVGNDSDWHRTRIGYLIYSSALVVQIGSKTWAIGRGVRGGAYPADLYDSDLAVVEIPDGTRDDSNIEETFSKNLGDYFRDSLIIGLANGHLAATKDRIFSPRVLEELHPDQFVAQEMEVDREYLSLSTLQPVVKSLHLYEPAIVDKLVQVITDILTEDV